MTVTQQDIIDAFSRELAKADSPAAVERLVARAKMGALQDVTDEKFEAPIQTLGEYLDMDIEYPPELVAPYIIVRGGLTCTIGRAGKGKTVMNLNRLFKWSVGRPMFDGWEDEEGAEYLKPERPLRTLIIENEGAGGLFHRQIGIMLNAEGMLSEEERELARENLLIWGDGGYSGLKLDDPAALNMVREGCEKHKPDIIFMEPLRGLWSGEENSATDMAIVVDNMVGLATDYNCGILVSHHERKSGAGDDGEKMSAGRGSTVLEGVVTVMENFESVVAGAYREITWSKSRYEAVPPTVRMEWINGAKWYKWIPMTDLEETIMMRVREADGSVTVGEMAELTDEKPEKLRKIMNGMVDAKRLGRMSSDSGGGKGSTGYRYYLPQEGDGPGGLSV